MKKNYRYEKKFMINPQQKRVICSRLEKICKKDPNSDEDNAYRVSSLYFDDYSNSAVEDKLIGTIKRKKFRIRIYNGSDVCIKLERKTKHENVCLKESVRISKQTYDAIISNNIDHLKKQGSPSVRDFINLYLTRKLRPRVIVDYIRQSYIYPFGNVRVTMDSHLHTSLGACDLFSDVSFIPVLDNNQVILEIKYTGFLPTVIRDMIQHGSGNMQAISKYTHCRGYF